MTNALQMPSGSPRFAPTNPFVPWDLVEVNQSISSRFERMVRARGSAVALRTPSQTWSYDELNRQADQIARELLTRSASREEPVALLLPHEARLIAAMLGVLKAGMICLTLPTSHPDSRLQRVVQNAGAKWLVTDGSLLKRAAHLGLEPDRILDLGTPSEISLPPRPVFAGGPDEVAFLIYTSGSTGEPRGVLQTHRNLLHNIRRHTHGFHYCAEDRVSLLASPASAQGVATALCALLNGATLCLRDLAQESVSGLAEWLREERISVLVAAASVFRQFAQLLPVRLDLPHLRVVRLASESVLRGDLELFQEKFSAPCLFANTYSSTETGNLCQFFWDQQTPWPEATVPVGPAGEGLQILALDEHGQPVPDGVVGELVVQSRYLSSGYWKAPEQTTAVFQTLPDGVERRYRTGDLGRLRPDGCWEHVGRKQHCKIRGHRVYPEELRRVLCQHPAVADAAIEVLTGPSGESRLCAHVVPHPGHELTGPALRRDLGHQLPDFLLPSVWHFLEALPRTPNGKVDRAVLAELRSLAPAPATGASARPGTMTEELIAGLFAEVLELERVEVDDNFFELGGDSLQIARLGVRLEEALQTTVPGSLLFAHPTPASLGTALSQRLDRDCLPLPPIQPAPRDQPLPLSFAQERNWRQSQTREESIGNLLANGFVLTGPLQADILEKSLREVVRRHESLRSTFALWEGQPRQFIRPEVTVPFQRLDLTNQPQPEAEAERLWTEEVRHPIDLATGPLLRATLLRLGECRHWLLLTYHHIVFDAWARDNLLRELATLYAAWTRGLTSPLPEPHRQFPDYAVWQRELLRPEGAFFQTQVAFWKRQLAGAPAKVHVPFERRGPAGASPAEPGKLRWSITPEVAERLRGLGRRHGATFFMTRLAAFAAHWTRVTGAEDFVVASYISNRNRPETHDMIGFFSNLVLLRLDVRGNPTFLELLARVRQTTLEAAAHAELPFEVLRAELEKRGQRPPKPRIIFEVKYGERDLRFGELEVHRMDRKTGSMPWHLQLGIESFGAQTTGQLLFDASKYEAAGVAETLGQYVTALTEFAAAPERRVYDSQHPRKRRPWWRLFGGP